MLHCLLPNSAGWWHFASGSPQWPIVVLVPPIYVAPSISPYPFSILSLFIEFFKMHESLWLKAFLIWDLCWGSHTPTYIPKIKWHKYNKNKLIHNLIYLELSIPQPLNIIGDRSPCGPWMLKLLSNDFRYSIRAAMQRVEPLGNNFFIQFHF